MQTVASCVTKFVLGRHVRIALANSWSGSLLSRSLKRIATKICVLLIWLATFVALGQQATAQVVWEDFQGNSRVTGSSGQDFPGPNYVNNPGSSIVAIGNLKSFSGDVANVVRTGASPNIDYTAASSTLCDTSSTDVPGTGPACQVDAQGRVMWVRLQFPLAGSYSFSLAHDDQVDVDLSNNFNSGSYKTISYNLPVGGLASFTANDTTFENLSANVVAPQANSCGWMRIYWNNVGGINHLRLRWTRPDSVTQIIPASAMLDPTVPPTAASCAAGVTSTTTSVQLLKNLAATGRVNAADQFVISINRPAATVVAGAGTGGVGVGPVADTGAFIATVGQTYTLIESMAAGSVSTLTQYNPTISCTRNGTAFVPGGTAPSWTVTPTVANDQIVCEIQNTRTPPPVADNDAVTDIPVGTAAVVDVLDGDAAGPGRTLNPASVQIVGTATPGASLVVAGQGTWSVNPANGRITFTPLASFTGNPTPISYTVADDQGNVSNTATVTVGYQSVPALQLQVDIASVTDTNGDGLTNAGDLIRYTFTVTNTGNVLLTDVNITSTSLPLGLVCVSVDLAPGATAVLNCTGAEHSITDAEVVAGSSNLDAVAAGRDTNANVVSAAAAAAAVPLNVGGITVQKRALTGSVRVGDVVPYQITVANTSPQLTVTANVVDLMPTGFVYKSGSATVAGVAAEPVISGSRLTFTNVTIAPGGSVTVALMAAVTASAQPGANVNRARVVDAASGKRLAPDATATVMLEADPVFDCGTVIGRVFDDANQDGYMNYSVKDLARTNDGSYVADGTAGRAPAVGGGDRGEQGLPGVRLVSVRGTIITTDKYGRFHVPCADLPRDIGSNFLLKLDERSLPTGYRLTTENPRVVRLTAGKMTEMNFGASITRLVRLDLSGAAFMTGKDAVKLSPGLRRALAKMITQIADTPSMLRITYLLEQDSERLAKQRMRAVEDTLRRLWPGNGRYKLNVETTVQHGADRAGNE